MKTAICVTGTKWAKYQGLLHIIFVGKSEDCRRLEERSITVNLTEEAKSWLAKAGFDPTFGARPLKRTIQREVENPLSKKILLGELKEGDEVKVDVSNEGLVFIPNAK